MRTLGILTLGILLYSCGTTRYLSVKSPDAQTVEKQGLVAENDTLRIIYTLAGRGLTVTVYNKSTLPIEINWKKSGFVMNERSTAYYAGAMAVQGDLRLDTAKSLIRSASYNGNLNGSIYVEQDMQFLPPRSGTSKTTEMLPLRIGYLPFEKVKKQKIRSTSTYSFTYKKLGFTADRSPLQFRSFLTYTIGGREVYLDHQFFVSEIWQSKSGPGHLPQKLIARKDWFIL